MWAHERQAKVLEILGRDGKVATNELAELFDVSRETVRRDLLEMETIGKLARVHGGAVPSDTATPPEPPFAERLGDHPRAKEMIGAKACELIPPGATVMIDAGTTTLAFARTLMRRGGVRIITNSIDIALPTVEAQDCEILLLGGRPHRDVPATHGEMTLSEIDRFLADFAVISPVGLHPERGATDYDLHEAEVARAMIRRAKSCMMLCHSSKIGMESRVSICGLESIDHLVTDADDAPALPKGEIHRTGDDSYLARTMRA